MIQQLNPSIPLLTPKGPAEAHFIVDYGKEDYFYFICFLEENGECWTFDNRYVRATENRTIGRSKPSPIAPWPPKQQSIHPAILLALYERGYEQGEAIKFYQDNFTETIIAEITAVFKAKGYSGVSHFVFEKWFRP